MAKKYSKVDVAVSMEILDDLKSFAININEGARLLANDAIAEVCKEIRTEGIMRKTPYPPSRNRTPGQTRRSVTPVYCVSHGVAVSTGNVHIDTWLFDWIEKRNDLYHSDPLKYYKIHRNVKQGSKGVGRFRAMLPSDPRRILGEPMERRINLLKNSAKMEKIMEEAVAKSEVK